MPGIRNSERLSRWWRNSVIFVLLGGFAVLTWVSVRSYTDAPPIPTRVATSTGETVFTGDDIVAGQQVFSSTVSWRTGPFGDTGPTSAPTSPPSISMPWP